MKLRKKTRFFEPVLSIPSALLSFEKRLRGMIRHPSSSLKPAITEETKRHMGRRHAGYGLPFFFAGFILQEVEVPTEILQQQNFPGKVIYAEKNVCISGLLHHHGSGGVHHTDSR